MKRNYQSIELLFALLAGLLFFSCNKEKLPTNLENPTQAELQIYVSSGMNTFITPSGKYYIQTNSSLIRYNLASTSPIGGHDFNIGLAYGGSHMPCTRYFDGKIWYSSYDTIYVFPENFNAQDLPLRKIAFDTLYDGSPVFFAVDGYNIYTAGMFGDLYQSSLYDLWNPIYDTTVFIAKTSIHETDFTFGIPLESKNGYLLTDCNDGLMVVDTTTLDVKIIIERGVVRGVEWKGNTMFLLMFNQSSMSFYSYDMTDPTNPILLDASKYYGDEMCYSDSHECLYVQDGDKIRVIDVSDPSDFELVDIYNIDGLFYDDHLGSVEVYGDYIYMISGVEVSKKLVVYEIPD